MRTPLRKHRPHRPHCRWGQLTRGVPRPAAARCPSYRSSSPTRGCSVQGGDDAARHDVLPVAGVFRSRLRRPDWCTLTTACAPCGCSAARSGGPPRSSASSSGQRTGPSPSRPTRPQRRCLPTWCSGSPPNARSRRSGSIFSRPCEADRQPFQIGEPHVGSSVARFGSRRHRSRSSLVRSDQRRAHA